jgi:hypothetical protein
LPDNNGIHDVQKMRVVRKEDVDILKAVTRQGHMVWALLGFLVTVIGAVFMAGQRYADIPTKDQIVSRPAFEHHVEAEAQSLSKLDGKLDDLTKSIVTLSTTVAVLNTQMADDERHAK